MADLESHNNGARRFFTTQVQLRSGYGAYTLAEDAQLTAKSPQLLAIDPGGSARNLDLPGILEGVPDTEGLLFWVKNTADAAETITVRDPANGTVDAIAQNQAALFVGTGGQAYAALGVWTIV